LQARYQQINGSLLPQLIKESDLHFAIVADVKAIAPKSLQVSILVFHISVPSYKAKGYKSFDA
jgi:hypothetical protein